MYQIDNIAVPVDASRSSRAAWALARSLADKNVTIDPLHVVERWPAFMDEVFFPYAPLGEDGVELEHELREVARRALTAYHEVPEDSEGPRVVFGPLKQTLIEELAKTPAQLVVAGLHGEGGPMPDSIGSVAHRLLCSARRPVLLTRGLELEPRVQRVLVAVDLSEGSGRVLEVAVRVAQMARAQLELLHVVPDPLANDQARVLGAVLKFDRRRAASQSKERVEALFEQLIRELEPSFADAGDAAELTRRRRVRLGDPALTIVEEAMAASADLIVVGSQSPRRASPALGRVAATVAQRSPSHVCVVPLSPLQRLADDD